ncbi:MAG: NADH-quinone oxidoreductase subunit N [Verrucomicrobiales bacterium]
MINPFYLEFFVLGLGLLILLTESFLGRGSRLWLGVIAMMGVGVAFAGTFFLEPDVAGASARFYVSDAMAVAWKRLLLIATILVISMAIVYLPNMRKGMPGAHPDAGMGEFFTLPVVVCAGLMWMVSAVDLVFLFIALELVTIGFYVLVSFQRRLVGSLEAGVKYLILGALSAGFLVYGIAWVFGFSGSFVLSEIQEFLPTAPEETQAGLLFGFALILAGLGFKVAAAPFHFWAPDVYQGAPTPVSAFLSVGSKAAAIAVLLRVVETMSFGEFLAVKLFPILGILAGATLLLGALTALPQTNFKRLLAYSSISHAGFLLVLIASAPAVENIGASIGFYLGAYLLMTFLAFLILAIVSAHTGSDEITAFRGLAGRSPILGFSLLIAMAALAGIPFTTGFISKVLVFSAAWEAQLWALITIGVVAVGAGFYYYFKILVEAFWKTEAVDSAIRPSIFAVALLLILSLSILAFGIYPAPLLEAFGISLDSLSQVAGR